MKEDKERQGSLRDVASYISEFKQLEYLRLVKGAYGSLFDLEECLSDCSTSLNTLEINGYEDPFLRPGGTAIEAIVGEIILGLGGGRRVGGVFYRSNF